MAIGGRKPQPAEVYLLKGSFGNHRERLGAKEDSPPISAEAPAYLGLLKSERDLWRELVAIWWWLPECAGPALAELCRLMVQSKKLKWEYDRAMRDGQLKAVQVLGRNMRMVRNDIKDYLVQFGVTPAERTRFLRQQTEGVRKRKKSLID